MCVCLIYRCLSLSPTLQACPNAKTSQFSIRGVMIKADISFRPLCCLLGSEARLVSSRGGWLPALRVPLISHLWLTLFDIKEEGQGLPPRCPIEVGSEPALKLGMHRNENSWPKPNKIKHWAEGRIPNTVFRIFFPPCRPILPLFFFFFYHCIN